jgi:hypothetical protein
MSLQPVSKNDQQRISEAKALTGLDLWLVSNP